MQNKSIRSFVLRSGRTTKAQKRAIDTHWSKWGLDPMDGQLSLQSTFGRDSETILEIGFGMGDSLIQSAEGMDGKNFIGVEVYSPGVGRLLHNLAKKDLKNVRVFWHDAVEVVEVSIPPASMSGINIFFPDPWHKKKHHKRRLINLKFVGLVNSRLRVGGKLHLSTDSYNYAEQMMQVLSVSPNLINLYGERTFAAVDHGRPETKFELRGRRLGHKVWDLVFVRS